MRIAIFDTSAFFAGFQRDATNLALGFARLGHEVDLILAQKDAEEFYAELCSSVAVIDLKASRAAAALAPLVRYLREKRPPVLISTSTETNLVALGARFLVRTRTRLVFRESSIWSIHADPRLRGQIARGLAKILYSRADAIVAVSEGVREDLCHHLQLPECAVTVIHNPTVTPGLIEKARVPIDHEWFRPGEPPVIVSAGRLHWHKDFPTLLRAFALLRGRRPARLMILGDGEERPRLGNLAIELAITPDFQMPGTVANPFPYLAASRLFVLSSPAESFGHVLVEAMACGTPVVSTNCAGGPPDILEHGRLGFLVPVGDAEALAQAMERTLDNPLPADTLREAALQYHCDRIVQQYLSLNAFRVLP